MVENVVMLASAADKGNYGCEILFNLSTPLGVKGGINIYLTRDSVTVVFSHPRIMIVKCRTMKFQMYTISAHAPYCKFPTAGAEASKWWAHSSSIVSSTSFGRISVLIGIVANYVVHSDASNGVGDVARSGAPPPQRSRVCDFLNDRS